MREKLFFFLVSFAVARAEISQDDLIKQLKKIEVPDSRFLCYDYNITGVSEKCDEQLDIACRNETLVNTILDASAKFPYAGLFYGTRRDFGNFDECMTVDHTYEGGRIVGEYCTAGLIMPDIYGDVTDVNSYYILGICRPDTCDARDLNIILSQVIEGANYPLFQDLLCQTAETGKEITAADIVTITIMSVCALLMLVSSIYDFYLYKTRRKCPNPLYLAFSVITNGKKLIHVAKNSKEQIYTFQGLKAISIMWIIAGHGFSFWQAIVVSNIVDVEKWQSKTYAGYITSSRLAVDTFFFISGFLLSYQYLKQRPKSLKAHVVSIPQMYIHRYLRLTPTLLMIFLVTISILKHMGSGPMWPSAMEAASEPCRKHWWAYFLYIQNYYNYKDDDMCIVSTWYLSADMQMFLLSPLVIIPIALYFKKSSGFKWSMIQMLILNIFCTFLPMVTKLVFQDYDNEYDTHSRLIVYFIGMMLGVFMRIKQDKPFLYMIKVQRKPLINLITWTVILLGMLAVTICHHEVENHHGYVSQSIFSVFMRPAWCIGLSWIVYSCYHGHGGFVNWILCRPIFQILGRLTYCMYLLHGLVELAHMGNLRNRLYFSDFTVFYAFCGHYIVTLILSVFWTLAFESPIIIIEKALLGGGNKKKEVEPPKNGNIVDGAKKADENV